MCLFPLEAGLVKEEEKEGKKKKGGKITSIYQTGHRVNAEDDFLYVLQFRDRVSLLYDWRHAVQNEHTSFHKWSIIYHKRNSHGVHNWVIFLDKKTGWQLWSKEHHRNENSISFTQKNNNPIFFQISGGIRMLLIPDCTLYHKANPPPPIQSNPGKSRKKGGEGAGRWVTTTTFLLLLCVGANKALA